MSWTITAWLFFGLIGFFSARAALSWTVCRPISLGTILSALLLMWVPPLTFVAALVWSIMNLAEHGFFNWLTTPLINPCDWFKKNRTPPDAKEPR